MNVLKYDIDWEIEQIENAIFYYTDAASFYPENTKIKKKLKSLYNSLEELKRYKSQN